MVPKKLLVVLECLEARDEMLLEAKTIESDGASLQIQFCVTLLCINDFLAVRRTPLANGGLAERRTTYTFLISGSD